MKLDWRQEGRIGPTAKKVVSFLDDQVFRFPRFAIQISGVRAGIVGTLQRIPKNSTVVIAGSLDYDGSVLKVVSNIDVVVIQ